jgi:AraC-like DNA-binding protein
MQIFGDGRFIGKTKSLFKTGALSMSLSRYSDHDWADWHCHENVYFAFILQGGNIEKRQEVKECTSGTMLFYHKHEPHCNASYQAKTKIFHLEIRDEWFLANRFEIPGASKKWALHDTSSRMLCGKILQECFIQDSFSTLSLDALVAQLLIHFFRGDVSDQPHPPLWVKEVTRMISELPIGELNLQRLSQLTQLHPATLSKSFPLYFHCHLGDYIRQVKVERSLSALADRTKAISDIALDYGFFDSSHYIKVFKALKGMTPSEFRKHI